MKKQIDPGLSLYLDIVRLIAAVVVMLSHVWPQIFPQRPLPWPGHAAVVVFFVLSGYVIAFASDRNGQTAGVYAVHRATRILSVTLPALLLSILIAPYVAGDPVAFAGKLQMSGTEFWRAIWMSGLFLNESWLGSVSAPFNPPFWSLSYEVWYYAIFGVWLFARPAWRLAATAAVALLAGLNILLLLPVWLLGVALYRTGFKLGSKVAPMVFAATVVVGLAYYWLDCSVRIRTYMIGVAPDFMASLHGSNQFIGDYLLGLIVSVNFLAAASMGNKWQIFGSFEKSIRYLSSFTLSIYLFHMPLSVFIWNGLRVRSALGFTVLLAGGIFVLGSATERRNKQCRRWVEQLLRLRKPGLASIAPRAHGAEAEKRVDQQAGLGPY
jgi:peptidoglycan/LPS O-acetylase OafA/YrhL